MIPHWPAALPQFPKRDMFTGGPVDSRARFATEYGPPILRSRTTADPEVYDATFRNLRLAQLTAFRTFYRDTLNRGAKSYSWRDPVYGDAALWKILGDGEKAYNVIARGADLHDLSLKLMRMPGTPWWAPYVQAGSSQVPYVVADYANGVYGVAGQKVVASDVAAVTGTFDVLTLDFADVETVQAGRVLTGAPRTNHVLWSEDLTNAVWTGQNASVSATSGLFRVTRSLKPDPARCAQVSQLDGFRLGLVEGIAYADIKRGNTRYVFMSSKRTALNANDRRAIFDLDSQTVTSNDFAFADAGPRSGGVIDLGSGVFRIWVKATGGRTSGGTAENFAVGPCGSGTDYRIGEIGDYVDVLRCQTEIGAAPTYYIPTGAAAASQPDGIPAAQPPGIKRISAFAA